MSSLKQIKQKIGAMKKSQAVTGAMEAVAAAKMRKAQRSALAGRTYARAAASVLHRVSGASVHALTAARPVAHATYVVITSDKGLAGALNSGVLRAANAHMGDLPASVVAVGKKAADHFGKRGVPVEPPVAVRELARRFASGETDAVYVAYQNFVSTFEQRPIVRKVFPLSVEELEAIVSDIVPTRGAFAENNKNQISNPKQYTIEPSEEEVMGVLLPKLAGIILYHARLEAEASEHSARMVAMKSASERAGEAEHLLTLQFNKARQAAITREVSEIIGGMEAVAN